MKIGKDLKQMNSMAGRGKKGEGGGGGGGGGGGHLPEGEPPQQMIR